MTSPYPIPSEPRRLSIRLPRPMWIGVATVVLVVAAVGLHVGVPIYRQHVAIREIKRLGGTVQTLPRGPSWLRQWIGDERMEDIDVVMVVDFRDTNLTDDQLPCVLPLTDLVGLDLVGTQVTDIGLDALNKVTTLKYVFLDSTKVSDAGLECLTGLTDLRKLGLEETQVTDAGLVHLKGHAHLEGLGLRGTQVTDVGLVNLTGLTRLKGLGLSDTRVTDAGVAELQRALPHVTIQR